MLALGLAGVGAVAWRLNYRYAHPAPGCEVPDAAPFKQPGTAAAAPGGGGLRLVEQGFSNVYGQVTYGAIVENTSASAAYRTRVTYGFSTNGKPIDQGSQRPQEIPIVLPGQRIGVAVNTSLPVTGTVTVAALHLGETTWLTRDEAGRDLKPVTTTVVLTEHPEQAYPGYLKVNFISSATCRTLVRRGAAAVVRDHSGSIVGGWLDTADGCGVGAHVTGMLPLLPATVDDARTQVFPYCDLQKQSENDLDN